MRLWFGIRPEAIEPPADIDSWAPLARELWYVIAAPRIDHDELRRVINKAHAENAHRVIAAAGAADELELYGVTKPVTKQPGVGNHTDVTPPVALRDAEGQREASGGEA